MTATLVRESTLSPASNVAHVAKQLAKSGKLADMLNGGEDMLRQVDPAARDALIKIARAVRYALARGSMA